MTQFTDLRTDAERIRKLRHTINSLRVNRHTIQKMSDEQAQDVSDVLYAMESLLLKYQGQRELLGFLEILADIMRQAAEGMTAVDDQINNIMVDNDVLYRQVLQARLSVCNDDAGQEHTDSIKKILAETSSKVLTKNGKNIDNAHYNQSNTLQRQ